MGELPIQLVHRLQVLLLVLGELPDSLIATDPQLMQMSETRLQLQLGQLFRRQVHCSHLGITGDHGLPTGDSHPLVCWASWRTLQLLLPRTVGTLQSAAMPLAGKLWATPPLHHIFTSGYNLRREAGLVSGLARGLDPLGAKPN